METRFLVSKMIPGMNSRQMQQMMKQMGIQQQDIEASRVEIFCADRKIIIEPAQVAAVNMMGQKTYQVTGTVHEESLETTVDISDEDVQTVVEQANVSQEQARAAIEEADGDLAAAIMKLQQ